MTGSHDEPVGDDVARRLAAALGDSHTIERELGGGGMSRVFLAEERAFGRQVVVKILPPAMAMGLSMDRFRREIQLAARLQHPHIVPVLTAGEADGLPYFTMPFVEGRSLRDRLRDDGPPPVRDAVNLLRDVATALAYAHAHGVVHRDIKPDNVLVSHGAAVVTDFGVAKALASARHPETNTAGDAGSGTLTALGMSLGTPAYMAPEQAAGDPATDHRADIYSFGVLAYELFAGEPPFTARAPHALIVAHLTQPPPSLAERCPSLPEPLVRLVSHCLQKDPADRPQDAQAVVSALDDALEHTAQSGSGAFPTRHGGGPVPAARPTRRGVLRAVAGVAIALAVVGGGALLWRGRTADDGRSASTAVAGAPTSIAVLPFTNSGGDTSDVYFSDGMTDELTSALSRVPGLRVASRTSAFSFRGKAVDTRDVARALDVDAVLEGRVRRDGSRLRVSVQLTNGDDGLAVWSDSYERQMADVFTVQDEIARSIATALQLRLAAGAERHGTDDLAAYDLYLRGRYHFHQRGERELRQAAQLFAQALARDSSYAQAWAGLADAAALLPIYGRTPADSAYAIARDAAERAVALDPALAEAHTTLGLVQKSLGEWQAAGASFERALQLDQQSATAHQWYSELLLITDHVDSAVAEVQRAATLDPLSPVIAAELSYDLGLVGRYDQALAAGRRGVSLDGRLWITHAFLGFAQLFAGQSQDALRQLDSAVALDGSLLPVTGALASAAAAAGDSARARTLRDQLVAGADAPGGSAMAVVFAELALGNRDGALDWLERAAERRDSWLYAMSVNAPLFDPIRASPRFAAVVRRMGLDPARLTRPTRGG